MKSAPLREVVEAIWPSCKCYVLVWYLTQIRDLQEMEGIQVTAKDTNTSRCEAKSHSLTIAPNDSHHEPKRRRVFRIAYFDFYSQPLFLPPSFGDLWFTRKGLSVAFAASHMKQENKKAILFIRKKNGCVQASGASSSTLTDSVSKPLQGYPGFSDQSLIWLGREDHWFIVRNATLTTTLEQICT